MLSATVGMLCMAAIQNKQAKILFKRTPHPRLRRVLQIFGGLLLLLSGVIGVHTYGAGIGLVTFCGWACLGAWLVALGITWRR
ncbi:MAG: DUF3325 domain-containing protein [Pseudomonadota bacterium]